MKNRFSSNAMDKNHMQKNVFRDSMGFLSHGYSTFLFDRMFDVMDRDGDGVVIELRIRMDVNFI
jgi:hypothetical protein